MTDSTQATQNIEDKSQQKELNFRALESRYQKQLDDERQARLALEQKLSEVSQQKSYDDDDDDDSEGYVEAKKLNKKLKKVVENTTKQTKTDIDRAVHKAIQDERKENWLKSHPDFVDTLKTHAEKLMERSPDLANTILMMPEGFERQQLVYQNIKALGIDKPPEKQSSIQDKIDANMRNPYYQPSESGTAPYGMQGDYSPAGQKAAFDKMKEMQSRLGIM